MRIQTSLEIFAFSSIHHCLAQLACWSKLVRVGTISSFTRTLIPEIKANSSIHHCLGQLACRTKLMRIDTISPYTRTLIPEIKANHSSDCGRKSVGFVTRLVIHNAICILAILFLGAAMIDWLSSDLFVASIAEEPHEFNI
jgi:hypothetical protein